MKIDKNVPLPPVRKDGRKWPFPQMQVGDSIFAEGEEGRRLRMTAATYAHTNKHTGWKYASRQENGGTRVWRIA